MSQTQVHEATPQKTALFSHAPRTWLGVLFFTSMLFLSGCVGTITRTPDGALMSQRCVPQARTDQNRQVYMACERIRQRKTVALWDLPNLFFLRITDKTTPKTKATSR